MLSDDLGGALVRPTAAARRRSVPPGCPLGADHLGRRRLGLVVGERGPLPLKFAQRRQFHFGQARISPMHGLAVVAQVFHGEAFRIARLTRSLRPSVAIGVQGDSRYLQALATLLKLRGSVAGANGSQSWEQGTCRGKRAQYLSDGFIKAQNGDGLGLLAGKGQSVPFPI